MQRPRVTDKRDAAERGKPRRVGPCHAERVAHTRRLWPKHRVCEDRIECRLERLRASCIQPLQRQLELRGNAKFGFQSSEAFFTTVNFQPAGFTQIVRRARLGQQRFTICVKPAGSASARA